MTRGGRGRERATVAPHPMNATSERVCPLLRLRWSPAPAVNLSVDPPTDPGPHTTPIVSSVHCVDRPRRVLCRGVRAFDKGHCPVSPGVPVALGGGPGGFGGDLRHRRARGRGVADIHCLVPDPPDDPRQRLPPGGPLWAGGGGGGTQGFA